MGIFGFLASRIMDNLLLLFVMLVVIAIVNVYLYREFMEEKQLYILAHTQWVKTTGKVSSAKRHDGSGYQSVGHSVAGGHYNLVTYAYEVGDKRYTKTEYLGGERKDLANYPIDSEMTVFYDPKHPRQSMWEYAGEPKPDLLKLINIVLFIFTILMVLIKF